MQIETIISTAIGIILGGLITWGVALVYYKKAGNELIAEQATDLILYKLQYPNAPTQLKRNENGEVVGLVVEMSAKI